MQENISKDEEIEDLSMKCYVNDQLLEKNRSNKKQNGQTNLLLDSKTAPLVVNMGLYKNETRVKKFRISKML
jgi:hypothetical protein